MDQNKITVIRYFSLYFNYKLIDKKFSMELIK